VKSAVDEPTCEKSVETAREYALTNVNSQASFTPSYDCISDELDSDRDTVSGELFEPDSDYSIWYTSGYSALSHFFIKPKLTLTALPPVKYQVQNVRWLRKDGNWEELGPKNVFFTYLKIQNDGKADAKNCAVILTSIERKPDDTGEFVFPNDMPLVYGNIAGHGFEMVTGIRRPFEILVDGKTVQLPSTQTIWKKGGKATLLLVFVVEGTQVAIVGLDRGSSGASAGFPLKPRTIGLRTTADAKSHSVKLELGADGSCMAEVLN
jgi:hypothetical protein